MNEQVSYFTDPEEEIARYLRVMRVAEKEQILKLLEIILFDKSQAKRIVNNDIAKRKLFVPKADGGKYVSSAFVFSANRNLCSSFWVYLSFLEGETADVKIIGSNEFDGIDFFRSGDFTRIIYIPTEDATRRAIVKRYTNPDETCIWVVQDPSEIERIEPLSARDSYVILRYPADGSNPNVRFYVLSEA